MDSPQGSYAPPPGNGKAAGGESSVLEHFGPIPPRNPGRRPMAFSLRARARLRGAATVVHSSRNDGPCIPEGRAVVSEHPKNRARSGIAMNVEEFRQAAHEAVEIAARHLGGIARRKVFEPMPAEERQALLERSLPERPVATQAILETIEREILSRPMGNGNPRFFGWVNSPPAPMGAIADFLASISNPSCAGGDHAAVYLERCAVRWLMQLTGFPVEASMGLLVSGGSAASLTCLAAARQRAARDHGWDVRKEGLSGKPQLVMYVSEEGHSCLRKAAELMGMGERGVRVLPVDEEFRMKPAMLLQALAEDRAAGRIPFCVAASAGTVNTGAIDPLSELADLCERERLWLHVDGAYGALGLLDPDLSERYRGMERCDSLSLDPHKWLSVPLECGCALVRDGALLRDTFSLVPAYLRTEEGRGFGGLPWYSEFGFQQSRGFRALKLWATLLYAGREGIREQVCKHLWLAKRLASLIRNAAEMELLCEPTLSVVNFRCVPRALHGKEEALDALNKAVIERLQSEGEVFLTGTRIHDRFSLRVCVLHYATQEEDLAFLLECVTRTCRAVSG
jgi:aromatic-L-amino-acid decarboxylase